MDTDDTRSDDTEPKSRSDAQHADVAVDNEPPDPADAGPTNVKQASDREYRHSVLVAGAGRCTHKAAGLSILIVANAVIQALLVWGVGVTTSGTLVRVLAAIGSLIWLLITLLGMARLGLARKDDKIGLGALASDIVDRYLPFAGWMVVALVIMLFGFWLFFWPGIVVMILFIYMPLVVADGEYRNPIGKSVVAIGQRFWRFVVTIIIAGIIAYLVAIALALGMAFLPNPLAPFVPWLIKGALIAWYVAAFGALYRSTKVGTRTSETEPPIPSKASHA